MAPRKRKAASIEATPLTRSKRLSSLRCARSVLQDLDSRRRHYEALARHCVETLSGAPPQSSRLSSFGGGSSTDPSLSSPPASKLVPTISAPPTSESSRRLRPVISSVSLNAILSVGDSTPEAHEEMRRLFTTLQTIPNTTDGQDSPEKHTALNEDDDLESFAQTLATEPFLRSDSNEIRLLGLCCFAEVFRIRAPNPPLDNSDMIPVCSAILEELCVFASPNDPMDSARFSLLEQLATVNTLVIVSENNHIVCDIFACIYALVRAHQSVKVRQYFADILVAILEEMEAPDIDVLDAALAPLVPSLRYTALAVSLAEVVIQRAIGHMRVPLIKLLNDSIRALRLEPTNMVGHKRPTYRKRSPLKRLSMDTEESTPLSQHHNHISDLIIRLNHLVPDVLIFVLPNLQELFRSEALAVRLAAMDLLARLFTSRKEMAESYPTLFNAFLHRTKDIEPQIRITVVDSLGSLMLLHPKQRAHIDELLYERALDSVEAVRFATVQSVGRVFDIVSDRTLERVFSRVQDKTDRVRSEALHQIISFYTIPQKQPRTDSKSSADTKLSLEAGLLRSAPSSMSGDTSGEADFEDCVTKRMLRVSSLPDELVGACFNLRISKEFRSALEVERAIFEKICIPLSKKEKAASSRGLHRMALFLAQLSPSRLSSFVAMSRVRSLARRELFKVCNLRLESRLSLSHGSDGLGMSVDDHTAERQQNIQDKEVSKSHGNIEEARKASRDLAFCLEASPGHMNDIQEQCLQLATAVDLKVFERCLTAIDCGSSEMLANEAAADATARLGSKSSVGRFCADVVLPRCRPFVFSSTVLNLVCSCATDIATEEREAAFKRVKMKGTEERNDALGIFPMESMSKGSKPIAQVTPMILVGLFRYLEMVGPQYRDALISATAGIKQLITFPISAEDWSAEVVLAGLRLGCNIPRGFLEPLDNSKITKALHSIILCKQFERLRFFSLTAKRAMQLILLMWEDGLSKTIKPGRLLSELMSRLDSFDGNVEHLIGPLASLCQIAKRAPVTYKSIALKSFDFARSLLNGEMNNLIRKHLSKADSNEGDSRFSEISNVLSQDIARRLGRGEVETLFNGIDNDFRLSMAEVVSRASKLLVYSLHHVDFSEETDSVAKTFNRILEERRGDAFMTTPDILGMKNDSDSDNEDVNNNASFTAVSDAVMCACNRLSMGRAVLYMARKEEFFASITPERMVTTVLLGQDEHPLVRLSFAGWIQVDVVRKRLPIRWTVTMALMAVDPVSGNAAKVKKMLTSVFQHRRKLCEIVAQKRKHYTSQFLPESTLADLLWTLSNLPEVEMEQESGYPESTKCIEFLIDCLCESREYASILNEYIETVCIAEDATEPIGGGEKTRRLKDMCRIASAVLRKRFLGRKLDLEHTRHIELPNDLYRISSRRRVKNNNAPQPQLLDVATKYNERRGLKRPGGPPAMHGKTKPSETMEANSHLTSQGSKGASVADDATEGNRVTKQRGVTVKSRVKKRLSVEMEESMSSRMDEAKAGIANGTMEKGVDNGNDIDGDEITAAVETRARRTTRSLGSRNAAQVRESGRTGDSYKAKRRKSSEVKSQAMDDRKRAKGSVTTKNGVSAGPQSLKSEPPLRRSARQRGLNSTSSRRG